MRKFSILILAMLCIMSACSSESKVTEADTTIQAIQQQEQQKDQEQQEQQVQQQEIQEEAEQQTIYLHTAIKGAVIDTQDGSAHFFYRKKCEICGNVEPGTTGMTSTRGTLKSGFRCSKCGNQQDIEIKSGVM